MMKFKMPRGSKVSSERLLRSSAKEHVLNKKLFCFGGAVDMVRLED